MQSVLQPFLIGIALWVALPTAAMDHDTLPEVNRRIVDQVNTLMGEKVDRGECWDLAATALNASGAHWDGLYGFGTAVDWRKEEVLPGDIIQFENVEVEHHEGNSIRRDSFGRHTAIVMQVHEQGVYTIAHQNFNGLRKVHTMELRMSDVRGGKLVFHRPVE